MASVNYYLKGAYRQERLEEIKDKKLQNEILDTSRQIFLMLSTGGVRIQIYTKKRIEQRFWDFKKQEIDCTKYRKLGTKLNTWLKSLREDVVNLATENELSMKQTTKTELEKVLAARTLEKSGADQFDEQFTHFLNQHKTGDGHSLRKNTLKKYNGLQNHLKTFASDSGIQLHIKYFDKEFLLSFKEHLIKTAKLNDNSVAKYIKAAKPLIRYYISKGVLKHYSLAEIKATEKEGAIFVLPIKHVLMLQNKKLAFDRLKHARDIFCFMCWTGQRYSDYETINHEDFSFNEKGEKVWKLVTVKTQDSVTVPIIPYAEEILKRHEDSPTPLPRLSNQKINEYLKELGKVAELNYKVKLVEYFDGKKIERFVPFYEILSTHIARKSFITNSLILGMTERAVKDISRHKDEKSFRRYVQLSDNYKSDMMSKAYSKKNISKFLQEA